MKSIFKVLKPNNRIPLLRINSKDEASTDWTTDDIKYDGSELVGEECS